MCMMKRKQGEREIEEYNFAYVLDCGQSINQSINLLMRHKDRGVRDS